MQTDISLISCSSTITFMLKDQNVEGYFSCIIPRSDILILQKTLEEFIRDFEIVDGKKFETLNVSCDLRNLGEFIIFECKSKIDSSGFRMMLDFDTSKRLQYMLIPEYEKSVCLFGKPLDSLFSWKVFSTIKEIEES